MRTTDLTAPGDDLLELAAKRVDLPDLPLDDDDRADAFLDLLTAMTEIRAELDTCEVRWIQGLAELGIVAKQCRGCPAWFASNDTGRPREYCTSDCRADFRRRT